ncbi:serine protease FAM111A-like [Melanotaenia boesemani]|uniref:serine protease FAM111A-like n=1 Tax=Melanotaenia boesemani TaxID=1250792 RepID=UPI001C03C8AD|nr:serine protease FAM111A-like [Melanotaenia boesemani]
MTVEEALKQDGRFVDNLTGFQLSNNSENNDFTKCTETVKRLHRGHYKICLPKQGQSKGKNPKQQTSNQQQTQQKNQHELNDSQCTAVNDSQCSSETREVLKLARENSISLKMAAEKTDIKINLNEIQELLRQQFPQLKELMEKRFPGQSLKKALNLQRENFGKIQQAFSEVHRVRELLDLSRSVRLLMVHDKASSLSVQGTGFVLFDNFILTNAHLFDPWAKDGIEKWWEHVKISAEFNFENPATESRKNLEAKLFGGDLELDFALLELVPENLNTGQAIEKDEVPPGLLKKFGPLPMDGHACLIGHPAGGVKKMDPTCVIRKEERDQAVNQNLDSYKDYIFTIYAINQRIKDDPKADICVTYNSFMYHGSSGSPVFDAYGRVFGLHTGGFFFGYPKPNESVIEFAFPLLAIFEKLVSSQEKKGNYVFLNRVLVEAEGNRYLEKIIKSVVGPRENEHEVQESEP